MPRDYRVYLEDILGAIGKIKRYTKGLSKQAFAGDDKTIDAVVRNLEVIGEAVKQLPADLRARERLASTSRRSGGSATSSSTSTSVSTWTFSGT
jgi:uncharacterized protein with HEPN domain